MMSFRKPVEEKLTGSYQVSRVVGRRKQGSEDMTMAVGCVVVRTAELFLERRD